MIFNRKFQALLSTSKSVISATSRSKSTVTLIPGDGIGPEIATAVERFIILFIISGMSRILFFLMVFFFLRIFEAAEAPIAWERVDVTPVRYPDGTMGIPKAVIDSVNRNKVGLKSPLMTPGI